MHRLPVPLARLAFQVAYRLAQVFWFVVRPRVTGVKVVLRDGDRVLLVRHSYGPDAWELPGGHARRGEPPELAARREILEELGLDVRDWRPLGRITARTDHKRETIHCFEAPTPGRDVTLARGELDEARWVDRPPGPVGDVTATVLAMARMG